jgi:hypothetical protein
MAVILVTIFSAVKGLYSFLHICLHDFNNSASRPCPLGRWYSTLFVRLLQNVISLQFCTLKVFGV